MWAYDLCASFQKAVVDVLVRKSVQAVAQARVDRLAVSGGVLCNKMLRDELEFACYEAGIDLIVAEPAFCTDNAGMIAGTAAEKLAAGIEPRCGDDINPESRSLRPRATRGHGPRPERGDQTQEPADASRSRRRATFRRRARSRSGEDVLPARH